jgi:hypothetical protein
MEYQGGKKKTLYKKSFKKEKKTSCSTRLEERGKYTKR